MELVYRWDDAGTLRLEEAWINPHYIIMAEPTAKPGEPYRPRIVVDHGACQPREFILDMEWETFLQMIRRQEKAQRS